MSVDVSLEGTQSAVPKMAADCNGSIAPVGLIELLTYRLHRMPIDAGKL